MRQRSILRGNAIGVLIVALSILTAIILAWPSALEMAGVPAKRAVDVRASIEATPLADPKDRITLALGLVQYQTDSEIKIWTGMAQALGASALFVGLVFTWLNLKASQAKLDVDRDGQVTNRFTQAVAQLGSRESLEVRIGGIYSLERIALDSPYDRPTIVEVLTACVRENAARLQADRGRGSRVSGATQTAAANSWPRSLWRWLGYGHSVLELAGLRPTKKRDTDVPAPEDAVPGGKPVMRVAEDIQAVLTVLGRLAPPGPSLEQAGPDLRATDLSGARIAEIGFARANFTEANLESVLASNADLRGASLRRAVLRWATLSHSNLETAILTWADIRHARLIGARLSGAEVRWANLAGAVLKRADLTDVDMTGADLTKADLTETNLTGANLTAATLVDAILTDADLSGAILVAAKLEGARLDQAKHVTQEQVASADQLGKGAILPSTWVGTWRDRFKQRQ